MQLFLNKKAVRDYQAALKSRTLDKSDFILLSTAILNHELGRKVADEIAEIQRCYEAGNLDQAVTLILGICANYKKDYLSLLPIIAASQHEFHDDPSKDFSRRYFETRLANKCLAEFDDDVFHSVGLLSALMTEMNPDLAPVSFVKSTAELVDVISKLHRFGDHTPVIACQVGKLKDIDDTYAKSKDRGKLKIDTAQDKLLSCNPGIMQAAQPNYFNELTSLHANHLVDLFYIDAQKQGYSIKHKDVPFVNSLSGTIFTLAVTLEKFILKHKSDPLLQQHILNITKAYITNACSHGFHSFAEMLHILYYPRVQNVITQYGLELSFQFPKALISSAFYEAADYAKNICLKSGAHEELLARPKV